MPAKGFTPFEPLDDHEFLPHDFVIECDAEEEEKGAGELGIHNCGANVRSSAYV